MDKDFLDLFKKLQKDRDFIKEREKTVKDAFDKIKEEIIEEFNNHPVTREIEAGIGSANISGTLNGVTNLYSFIGFYAGTDPITPIRELLEKSTYRIIASPTATISKVVFEIPTAKMIFNATPMPWAIGRSWAKGIETGISGIGYYLKLTLDKNSRSGLGVQSQKKVRTGVRFKNTKYISDLINKFEKELKNLN